MCKALRMSLVGEIYAINITYPIARTKLHGERLKVDVRLQATALILNRPVNQYMNPEEGLSCSPLWQTHRGSS